ncbi:NAD(P)-dependent oxidoreductase [Actinomadura opuntiae]|uniref:NAD(P)-dependent oxidoreductase n=1 Tax=Actinomadura sp. OS1-43 TaxID=604315 RepID=UPI00255A841C|nr:NAD(P)-dependent oxidoreductase [Actinomadura sp. OS1-43]MDL4815100.1 NAD(P)-dependent oxidoreductase [Actinomadura sp. OS1-43]
MSGIVRVGFVGLGDIGKPMATRLAAQQAEAGLALGVFDLATAPVEELVAAGAKAAGGVGALAAGSDVLCVMVNNDRQVRSVLDEVLAADGVGEGLTVAVHSTVAPETPAELEELAARRGVRLVDAPVSGGAMGAGTGELAVMVGGSEEAFAAVRPVLDVLAKKVVHAGPIGAGTRFKLARNLMHYVAFTAATEAQRLAEAAGLDIVALGEVVRHTDALTGGPGAIMYRDTTAELEPGSFWYTTFGHLRQLAEKDLDFAVALADELGVDVPLARIARERLAPGLGFSEEQA